MRKLSSQRQLSIVKQTFVDSNKPLTIIIDFDKFSPEELLDFATILRKDAVLTLAKRSQILNDLNRSRNYVS
jgi:hypothetical protein